MNGMRLSILALGPLLAMYFLLAGLSQAATPDEDMRPLKAGITVTGVIEDDYTDGLLLTTDEGVSYLILTPEEITLEQEEAFHKRFKGKRVSITGNLYRDEDGTLSVFVDTLPTQAQ